MRQVRGRVGRSTPPPLDRLAAAVGFSRVYTGAHYPGDVLAGWALGRGVAVATRRVGSRVAPEGPV